MALSAEEKIEKIKMILGDWFSWTEFPTMAIRAGIEYNWAVFQSGMLGKTIVLGGLFLIVFFTMGFWLYLKEKHESAWAATVWLIPYILWQVIKVCAMYTLIVLTIGAAGMAGGVTGGRRRR